MMKGVVKIRVEGLSSDELRRNFERALSLRWRLVWDVGVATGLRISDVLSLKTEQLGERKTTLSVREIKTGKLRKVKLPVTLASDLRSFAGEVWVFESPVKKGRPLSRSGAYRGVRRAAYASGIETPVGTHSARKTYAQELYDSTGDAEAVRRELKHNSIGTTMLYIHGVNKKPSRTRPVRSRAHVVKQPVRSADKSIKPHLLLLPLFCAALRRT